MATTKKFYAIKFATPFGTYTIETFKKLRDAQEMIDNSERKGYFIQEVDGVYNGVVKLDDNLAN